MRCFSVVQQRHTVERPIERKRLLSSTEARRDFWRRPRLLARSARARRRSARKQCAKRRHAGRLFLFMIYPQDPTVSQPLPFPTREGQGCTSAHCRCCPSPHPSRFERFSPRAATARRLSCADSIAGWPGTAAAAAPSPPAPSPQGSRRALPRG